MTSLKSNWVVVVVSVLLSVVVAGADAAKKVRESLEAFGFAKSGELQLAEDTAKSNFSDNLTRAAWFRLYWADIYAARVQASGEERLVVALNWDPGWRAQVDDQDVPVLRSAPSFLAVEVPPGEHRVTLDYHGPAERGPLSLLAFGGLLALLLRGAFGRRVLAIGRALGYRREP